LIKFIKPPFSLWLYHRFLESLEKNLIARFPLKFKEWKNVSNGNDLLCQKWKGGCLIFDVELTISDRRLEYSAHLLQEGNSADYRGHAEAESLETC
jgi:hypothetical protein